MPKDHKGDQIHFGQGGGFSGVLQYYVLLDNGQVFQRGYRDSIFTHLTTWNRSFTDQMFSNFESLQLDTVDFYEPGDLYYFIEFRKPNFPPHRIAWGRPGYQPKGNIVKYYNLLFKSIKSES
jgi:hypothetical protein